MKLEKFIKRNAESPIYKGAWNDAMTKITYWFVDGGRATLSAADCEKVNPRWIELEERK